MDKNLLIPLVEQIRGCTFASLDATTEPCPGIMHSVERESVIIFRTSGKSGWEGMIKRRLAEAGKDPDTFKVGPLPWGERLGNLPIIRNGDKYYLQVIQLAEGKHKYYITGTDIEVNPQDFGIKPARGYQGLPPNETVKIFTYNIDNIDKVSIMGHEVGVTADKANRAILSVKV